MSTFVTRIFLLSDIRISFSEFSFHISFLAGYLWTGSIPYWIGHFTDYKIYPEQWGNCKPMFYFEFFFQHTSSWLLVIMTVERCIVIWFPLKAKEISNLKKAKRVTASLMIFFLLYEIQWIFVIEISVHGTCNLAADLPKWYTDSLEGIDATVYCLAPFTIMILSNCLICLKLLKRENDKRLSSHDQMAKQQSQRITLMLLSVSFVFCALIAPVSFHYILHKTSRPSLIYVYLINLDCLNHAVNFVLYVLSGKKFRTELLNKLRRKKVKQRHSNSSQKTEQLSKVEEYGNTEEQEHNNNQ